MMCLMVTWCVFIYLLCGCVLMRPGIAHQDSRIAIVPRAVSYPLLNWLMFWRYELRQLRVYRSFFQHNQSLYFDQTLIMSMCVYID